ncbi:BamA/TamA family outer membrane protein [Shewanella waksmanii]|uniref:BamA/TamA family outer membrane protein n=1 Tax=Shewanella waksmanii TaxID=213783 RepID=UPI0037352557
MLKRTTFNTPMNTIAIGLGLLATTPVQADFWQQLSDPNDGQFDASQWILDNAHGFMPVPFIITEPAVGTGGGAALLFFHETAEQKQVRQQNPNQVSAIPPSVTGLVGGATSNGSKFAGLFHSGNWAKDNIRYLGGIMAGSINLDYYTPITDMAAQFNIEGLYFLQDIDFRLADSNFFAGLSYTYVASKTVFDIADNLPGIDPLTLDSQDAALSAKLSYDSRDNQFSPRNGLKAGFEAAIHHPNLGGDFSYQQYSAHVHHFQRLNTQWGLRLRGEYDYMTQGAPFYARPFINMRGIAAMRYQGDQVSLAELQIDYDINNRWTLLGFGGVGKAVQDNQSFTDADWQATQGTGFRYLIARQLGLRSGIDVAKGPEEWTFYIQFGSAWR